MTWYADGRNDQHLWRDAHHVAELLDTGNYSRAEQKLRHDLYQMQNDPREQHAYLNMITSMERRGFGADLQIQLLPDGREAWRIIRPAQNPYERSYPCPSRQCRVQYPYEQQPYHRPNTIPDVVVMERRPDPGAAILEGIAIGVGMEVGRQVINRALGGHHNYYEHRGRRPHYR